MTRRESMSTRVRDQHNPGPLAIHRLHARLVSGRELEWFFNAAECDMGNRTNFYRTLGLEDPEERTIEDDAEAVHAHRVIRGWLKAIPDREAGILQCAYETRPWPQRLKDDLGKLTGIVVRLTCATNWPEDRTSQELVEMARARWLNSQYGNDRSLVSMVKLRREAELLFARAMLVYDRARGQRPCVLPPTATR
jgi:hypothetical protein